MKKGLSDAVFTPTWDTKSFLRAASEAKFEGVELNVREGAGEFRLDTSVAQAQALSLMAEDFGIEIASVTTGLHNHYALNSEHEEVRKCGVEIALRMIDFAAAMKAKVVQIVPGVVSPSCPYDVSYHLATESLSYLAREASSAGVTIGVENVCNKFLPSPLEFGRFLDEINEPAVKAYFDNGNAMVTGYPEHFVSLLGHRIVAMHAKNYRISAGDFVSMLEGDCRWPALIRALRAIPYAGYLIATPPYPYVYCLDRLMDTVARDLTAVLCLE